jgi:hypothetical protein
MPQPDQLHSAALSTALLQLGMVLGLVDAALRLRPFEEAEQISAEHERRLTACLRTIRGHLPPACSPTDAAERLIDRMVGARKRHEDSLPAAFEVLRELSLLG